MLNHIVETYSEDFFLKADGFDEAIIGVELKSWRLIYSIKKCIHVLMKDHGMTQEEAVEYFYFNVEGSYVGEKTPIWCEDNF